MPIYFHGSWYCPGLLPLPPSPIATLLGITEPSEEISLLQRSVSVCCRAEVIITYTPSTLLTCETHVYPRVEKSIAGLALRLY
jgi:hypothetical protein